MFASTSRNHVKKVDRVDRRDRDCGPDLPRLQKQKDAAATNGIADDDVDDVVVVEGREEEDSGVLGCGPKFMCQQTPIRKCYVAKSCARQGKKADGGNGSGGGGPPYVVERNLEILENANAKYYAQTETIYVPNQETIDDRYSRREPSTYVITKKTDVFVERDENGSLGLTLQGGVHPTTRFFRPLVVTDIRADGPTEKEGSIQVGDRLLAVDDYSLHNLTLTEAYQVLRQSGVHSSSKLTVEYDVTVTNAFKGPLLVEVDSPNPHQLGLTLTNTPHNAAVLVDEVKTASIAERCGALHPGDQILSVNEIRVKGAKMSATEVHRLIRTPREYSDILLLEILPAYLFSPEARGVKNGPKYANGSHKETQVFVKMAENTFDASSDEHASRKKEMRLRLHSDDKNGYGLSVCTSAMDHAVCFICSITPCGPADTCERLRVNDRILTANDAPLAGVGIGAQPLHKVPGISLGGVDLLVEYDVPVRNNLPAVFTVQLAKENDKNLGITITGCNEYVLISDIKPGSSADRCGFLEEGDRILSINDVPLANCSVQQALEILHSQSDLLRLKIEKQPDVVVDAPEERLIYTVQLNKQNGPIGITITGSDTAPTEITISAITAGGLADRTGTLHVGDRVLAIDEQDVSLALLSEATALLQKSGQTVSLKVAKRPDRVPVYSPVVVSEDSAVESWESSTQRDNSPNDIPFRNSRRELERSIHVTKCRHDPIYTNVPSFKTCNRSFCDENLTKRNQNNSLDYDIDEIFSITDFADNADIPEDSAYEIYRATLRKDPLYEDFGFSISDGLYERGVFINSIRPLGPADKSRVLQPYDQILQVNNVNTEEFDCCLTVPLIASAGDVIHLLVRRKKFDSNDSKVQIIRR